MTLYIIEISHGDRGEWRTHFEYSAGATSTRAFQRQADADDIAEEFNRFNTGFGVRFRVKEIG